MSSARVVLVIDSLQRAGAQRQLVRLFLALHQRAVDVQLITYQPVHFLLPDIPMALRNRVISLAHRQRAPLPVLAWRLRRALVRARAQVVISFLRGAAMLVGLARRSGLRFGWIASERSGTLDNESPWRVAAYLRLIRAADRVAPNAHAMADVLAAAGVERERLVVMPNGLALDPDALATPVDRAFDPPRLLVVGNRVPAKNHGALYQALGRLKDRPWVLDHLGRCGDHPEEDRAAQQAIDEHGLHDRIRERGRQPDVGRWYAQATALLHPSRSEGFPNVVLEAWAWGCPVVVSDRGDLPRIVEDGRTGRVARLDEPGHLDQVLAEVLDAPGALAPVAIAARQELAAKYTIDAVAERWIALIEGVRPDVSRAVRSTPPSGSPSLMRDPDYAHTES